MIDQQKVKALAQAFAAETIDIRRHIHANPELSYEEFETAKYVTSRLQEWGIAYKEGVAGTGVVGLIYGKNPEKCTVALRGDMDALPITETNEVSYKSKNE